jgi:hypothetical protein
MQHIRTSNDKNCLIIPIAAENTFEIEYHFMRKVPKKQGIEW